MIIALNKTADQSNFFAGTATDTSRRGLLDLLTNELVEQSEMQIMSTTL